MRPAAASAAVTLTLAAIGSVQVWAGYGQWWPENAQRAYLLATVPLVACVALLAGLIAHTIAAVR